MGTKLICQNCSQKKKTKEPPNWEFKPGACSLCGTKCYGASPEAWGIKDDKAVEDLKKMFGFVI